MMTMKISINSPFRFAALLCALGFTCGCAALFGWKIHAPGMLSGNFEQRITPTQQRIALYLEPSVFSYISKDRGDMLADPTTFYIGESYAPMLLEGFQQAFDEFVYIEAEPAPDLLKRYGLPLLAVVRIKNFENTMSWKGQGVKLTTETLLLDSDLNPLDRFESSGSSDVEKVFAKKGGPEVNLNAALEHNVTAIIQYIQDGAASGKWRANV